MWVWLDAGADLVSAHVDCSFQFKNKYRNSFLFYFFFKISVQNPVCQLSLSHVCLILILQLCVCSRLLI